ncbi:MAG TPA: ABC transporter ATP-binding protein [Thermodesulfovibrionales bacterium]|nr:ABC transporter ATP-binding protein [Thermodesulfovibrionales bacterium]
MNQIGSAVKIEGLTRRFGDFVAVNGISLHIGKGEIFGFLGPNGAGKSTTIKMLCGLLLPSGGQGSVGGHDIMTESEEIKKNIGYMSQKFSLYDDLTVKENIRFFSGMYGVLKEKRKERMDWALEMAGLEARGNVIVGTLPGGFKQRLALGCAILHEPHILFLDEPTSGVDPLSRRNFWSLIYEMAGSGTTVFVTTHYMDEADYCNRLALIYRGKIIAEGTPMDLRERYMRSHVLELEAERMMEALDVLDRRGMDVAIFGSRLHVTVEDVARGISDVRRILESSDIQVTGIKEIAPSLEDVFVTLIEVA